MSCKSCVKDTRTPVVKTWNPERLTADQHAVTLPVSEKGKYHCGSETGADYFLQRCWRWTRQLILEHRQVFPFLLPVGISITCTVTLHSEKKEREWGGGREGSKGRSVGRQKLLQDLGSLFKTQIKHPEQRRQQKLDLKWQIITSILATQNTEQKKAAWEILCMPVCAGDNVV